ncbi:MAG TPA: hypothetical protein VMF08_13600 [Candidatus Sulfotelmatobacter sp.]|nr:hypothetical protein [Candidatus Sulfotelmatobacter sp.]
MNTDETQILGSREGREEREVGVEIDLRAHRGLRATQPVAQTSKSAVSQVSKPAGRAALYNVVRLADLEIGDTAGLETCATSQPSSRDNNIK